ncbi:MAG: hypothetical protein IH582_09205, partial [Afipia sp.]|nr:hypothetical protein [Afipia sp.]
MANLNTRSFRIFAVLENYRGHSSDILEALIPFFEPILEEFSGTMLDRELFALRVSEAYRWNFTGDIVEEFIPRFSAHGWLKEISKTNERAVYQVTYQRLAEQAANPNQIQVIKTLLDVSEQFKTFINKISPLAAFDRSVTDLSDLLVEWLISIDAYTEDVLKQQAIKTTYTNGQLGLAVSLEDASRLNSEERYLCARFVRHLFDVKSEHIAELCKIASVGLLTEVIQDFR